MEFAESEISFRRSVSSEHLRFRLDLTPYLADVLAAWETGQDFIIQDIRSPWDGKPINLEDARKAGMKSINLRYKRNTQVVVVAITVAPPAESK